MTDKRNFYIRFVKRPADFIVTLFLLVTLSPVLILLSILIRIRLGSPVFFRQDRPGLNSSCFELLKFRTMRNNTDEHGQLLPDQQRLGSFGQRLRATSLDELPEFWNVLRGDMSLVGPRPLLVEYLSLYSAEQARRHEVRPGITGWAQVHGRNSISWQQKFELDVWYVDNLSFTTDVKILVQTIKTVLSGRGVNASSQQPMPPFTGWNQ